LSQKDAAVDKLPVNKENIHPLACVFVIKEI